MRLQKANRDWGPEIMSINPLQQMHEQAEATFLPYGTDVQIVESFGEVEAEYAAIRKGVGPDGCPAPGGGDSHRERSARVPAQQSDQRHESPQAGQGCYAYLLNLKGRIVMDMNILQAEEATLVEMDQRLAPDVRRDDGKVYFHRGRAACWMGPSSWGG